MKNQVIKSGILNLLFVVMSQFVTLILGIAKSLILPMALGVTNFGYWQVYLLYLSYVGLFAFGFNDGIYLRYGKYNYDDLPKPVFRSSIRIFVLFQIVIMIAVSILILFETDSNKQSALFWTSINIPIAGLMGVLIYILQVTNQMKKYSFFSVLDKVIILVVILSVYFTGIDNFLLIIISDTFSKLFVLLLLVYSCRDILFGKGSNFRTAYKEIIENISVGIKLMLANICGMLIMGFGRFIVERFETIDAYGIYSFAISTTNLVLVFVSAIGLVIYPTLNRLSEDKFPKYLTILNEILTIIFLGLLVLYFPLSIFINNMMFEFRQIFEYLPFIFAVIFIQAKMQILVNPYYKLLRDEGAMLKANFTGLLLAVLFITPLYIIFNSVFMIAFGTFLAMGIRLYLSEFYLKKKLNIKKNSNVLIEILGIMLFLLFAYQNNIVLGFIGYFLIYLAYLIPKVKILLKYYKSINFRRGL